MVHHGNAAIAAILLYADTDYILVQISTLKLLNWHL